MQTNVCYISGSVRQCIGRLPAQPGSAEQGVGRLPTQPGSAGQGVGRLPTQLGSAGQGVEDFLHNWAVQDKV